jgi:hypothetical protein
MRRRDRLMHAYVQKHRARGISASSVARIAPCLTDWDNWMKSRRPRPMLEQLDADLLVRYIESRSH